MTFNRFPYSEHAMDYLKIHKEIFPEDTAHIPAIFYKAYTDDGKYLGFFSGYLDDIITFYIQRIGIPEAYRNKRLSRKIVNEIWDHLKSEGFQFLKYTDNYSCLKDRLVNSRVLCGQFRQTIYRDY